MGGSGFYFVVHEYGVLRFIDFFLDSCNVTRVVSILFVSALAAVLIYVTSYSIGKLGLTEFLVFEKLQN